MTINFLFGRDAATRVAREIEAKLTSPHVAGNLQGNAYNRLVRVNLTSPLGLTKYRKHPRGLLRLVSHPGEAVPSAVLPSTDYIQGKKFCLKGLYSMTVGELQHMVGSQVLDILGKAAQAGDEQAVKILMDSMDASAAVSSLVDHAVDTLTTQMSYTVNKIVGDALNGEFTLEGAGIQETFQTDIINAANPVSFWNDPLNATPIADGRNLNSLLKGADNNDGNGIRGGTTLLTEEALSFLLETKQIKDTIVPDTLGNAIISLDKLNEFSRLRNPSNPVFGEIVSDPDTFYFDDSGQRRSVLDNRYIWAGTGTSPEEAQPVGGMPAPIEIDITPTSEFGLARGTVISDNREGFALKVLEIPARTSSEQDRMEIVITGNITVTQYRPIVRLQVLPG